MYSSLQKFGVIIFFFAVAVSSCTPANTTPSIDLYETASDQPDVFFEKVHLNNCGGKADVKQVAERSREIRIEGEVEIGVQAQVVEGKVGTRYFEGQQSKKSIELVAASATNMEFFIAWTDRSWTGNIIANGVKSNATYKVNVPVSVELVNTSDLGCGNSNSPAVEDQAKQEPNQVPTTAPPVFQELSPLCEGTAPLIFHDGIPVSDPCGGEVGPNIVSGVWVVVEPRTKSGWQTGKCLFDYSENDPILIFEGSIWALYQTNRDDNALPMCPETKG